MATVGQALIAPEVGWRRYDDSVAALSYSGVWTRAIDSNCYNGSLNYATALTASLKFNFTGTRIRILDNINPNRSTSIKITIDGVTEFYSTNGINLYQALVFEKQNLANVEHSVIIELSAEGYIGIDSIDIDSDGVLKPFMPVEKGEAVLRVTMIDSSEREYKLPMGEITGFVNWYDREMGTGTTVYMLNKMTGSKEYLAFDKIISFEVN